MVLSINGKNSGIDEILNGKLSDHTFTAYEKEVIRIVRLWKSREPRFSFETSGSTGSKKEIQLDRRILEYSAQITLDTLDPESTFSSSLICINPHFIGGAMALIRAMEGNHDITFVDPSSNPLIETGQEYFDLISMVPLQVQTILNTDPFLFEKVGTVIIGGAPLPEKTVAAIRKVKSTRFFHSYGMTETASHFALKNLKHDTHYQTLGDSKIELSETKTLSVKGTITQNEWIETTDIVQILNPNQFVWLGRADHIINTGGVKVNPEEIERILGAQINAPFILAGIPDEKLGQKLVLILELSNLHSDIKMNYSKLDKYQIPKEIVCIPQLSYTETGKINRRETVKLLLERLIK